ncbi:glycosyltransferase [Pedobacter sp. MC2016-24]|uniref:glycosyltransferase n=1 Tax=Pedobacter sp. MC2016-24 TaxID=2780090 RepID=UPI00187F3783|nr:glycosyltransferase [Pedobacter sp. MC2016-24]MBE9602483.1 glycosyltransferase [Pedobacter sp. MC2016-24]
MEILKAFWLAIQFILGYNLLFPGLLYLFCLFFSPVRKTITKEPDIIDYGIIVTAFQYTNTLVSVIGSILKLNYSNYLIYIVADNCDISELHFEDPRVILLRPEDVLASNTASHAYAIQNFKRAHDCITIVDSDNLVDPEYLNQLNINFSQGFDAVQGLRAAKNLDGKIACLDAARDIYYHFYDGKLLYQSGSSATLSGSGMAFRTSLYISFLNTHKVTGAGFDKVLQAWILLNNKRIAFNEHAVVFDEKTAKTEQLVNQRSRWINTWFKYFKYGFHILFKGIYRFDRNQFIFGFVLLRPPLFIFLILALGCLLINLLTGSIMAASLWTFSILFFVLFFFVALWSSNTDQRIYASLKSVPKFIFFQLISLTKAWKANKISISTKHEGYENRI